MMSGVKPKKNLGQHFLKDQNIARKIVDSLSDETVDVLEVGPGMGVLTNYLTERKELTVHAVEIDRESVEFLQKNYPEIVERLYAEDFLKFDFSAHFKGNFAVIGNFPYNISSQIFFRVLDYRDRIPEVVGMVQKEVAERMCAVHGNKTYGILSVLLQTFYNIEYLFTVSEHVFAPPPKVKSAVVRLTRNQRQTLPCSEKFFVQVVKTSFNQRRKMLRNSLKEFAENIPAQFAEKRPEQLSVNDYILLVTAIEK